MKLTQIIKEVITENQNDFGKPIIDSPIESHNYTGFGLKYVTYNRIKSFQYLWTPHRPKEGDKVFVDIDGNDRYVELSSDLTATGRGSYRDERSGLERELKIMVDKDENGYWEMVKFVDVDNIVNHRSGV